MLSMGFGNVCNVGNDGTGMMGEQSKKMER
jgi:hypothetical protein